MPREIERERGKKERKEGERESKCMNEIKKKMLIEFAEAGCVGLGCSASLFCSRFRF